MVLNRKYLVALLIVAATMATATLAKEKPAPRRAKPPKWTAEDLGVFFDDARQMLVGERPNYGAGPQVAEQSKRPEESSSTPSQPSDRHGDPWSKLVDADTLETEIKRLASEIAKLVSTPSTFKGGGYKECRRSFSELALLFSVVAKYDGSVRWKDSAPALRDVFARAGRNCKVGTDQTFNESRQRQQDLADLVSGSRPSLPKAGSDDDWAQIADRPPLMERLELAQQERLAQWLATEREFKRNQDAIRHEAQLVALIAATIGHKSYDYADDEEYAHLARELREAATELSTAAEAGNYEQARAAEVRASKSCVECHSMYRG